MRMMQFTPKFRVISISLANPMDVSTRRRVSYPAVLASALMACLGLSMADESSAQIVVRNGQTFTLRAGSPFEGQSAQVIEQSTLNVIGARIHGVSSTLSQVNLDQATVTGQTQFINSFVNISDSSIIGGSWNYGLGTGSNLRAPPGTPLTVVTINNSRVAGNLAGGTHHAYADKGSGFCVFNDAAVAARLMQAEWARARRRPQLRVAIVDLDVHQGNGTAHIFQGDASVFTLSLHGERNFPFRKEASDLDVPLPDGCGDADYLQALDQALQVLAQRFRPDLVLYLAGADPHEGDRLGRLALSYDGLQARDHRVFDWAWQRRVPLAFSMAGGYGRDIHSTVQAQLNTWRVALQYHARWQNAAA